MRASGTVAVALFLVTTVRASFGDDPKAATPNVAAWIERLGSSDEAQAREAQRGLLGRLRLGEDVRRTDEQKADLLTFEDALAGTDGARQRRLIGVLAELVDSNAFDLTDSWWDRFEIDSVARSWAGHGSLVLDPLLAIVRHGGNDSRDPLGETVALALAAIGDPAVDPLLRIVATPPDPIPGPDATDRDELLATAIGRFGARSRAAYALARIPSARERAIGPIRSRICSSAIRPTTSCPARGRVAARRTSRWPGPEFVTRPSRERGRSRSPRCSRRSRRSGPRAPASRSSWRSGRSKPPRCRRSPRSPPSWTTRRRTIACARRPWRRSGASGRRRWPSRS